MSRFVVVIVYFFICFTIFPRTYFGTNQIYDVDRRRESFNFSMQTNIKCLSTNHVITFFGDFMYDNVKGSPTIGGTDPSTFVVKQLAILSFADATNVVPTGFAAYIPAFVNKFYLIRTRNGSYAIIQILGFSADSNTMSFAYVHQDDGSLRFK